MEYIYALLAIAVIIIGLMANKLFSLKEKLSEEIKKHRVTLNARDKSIQSRVHLKNQLDMIDAINKNSVVHVVEAINKLTHLFIKIRSKDNKRNILIMRNDMINIYDHISTSESSEYGKLLVSAVEKHLPNLDKDILVLGTHDNREEK